MEVFDISSGVVQLVMAIVLVSIKIPYDKHWNAMRRMNKLLFACYVCIGVSNMATGLLGVSTQNDPVIWLAMLLVSMYQALLFTATCVTFLSSRKAGVRWLSANAAAVTIVCAASVALFCHDERDARLICVVDAILYTAQLAYYCRLFRRVYNDARRRLEECYDEDMSANIRWITGCFVGALTVGISALLFAVLQLGTIEYVVFTSIYTLYYIYIVICVINYRISAGFIVKVVASEEPAEAEKSENTTLCVLDAEAEQQLQSAIERWVAEKRFVQNDQTVEEIAAELGTTHTMLKWYFTNRMHTTFRTWRLDLRVAEAKRLLSQDDIPVAMVHKMVGVADKSNFHKLFRKQVGMTPKEYKEQMHQESMP